MQNIFQDTVRFLSANVCRLFGAFFLGAVVSLCAMEDGAPYTGGEYVSPFKTFEFRGEVVGFSDTIAPGQHIKACTLLYIFRDNDTKRDALLTAMTCENLWIDSSEQNASISVQRGHVAAFTASGKGLKTIFFNLTDTQYNQYRHYCDSRHEEILVSALKGEAHKGPNGTWVEAEIQSKNGAQGKFHKKQSHHGVRKTQSFSLGATLSSFMRGTFSFFTKRPILSAGIVLGGFWWYRTKYKNVA